MINAVIIDDEKHSVETLNWKLERCCSEVKVVAKFTNSVQGLKYLQQNPPDLLFVDIEMPRLNGFELLEQLEEVPFDVIFTTAYDEFGIRAIKFSALDYLLKPIQNEELKKAVEKFSKKNSHSLSTSQLEVLFSNIKEEQNGKSGKIALATKESIEFVFPDEIIACTSDSNYTLIHLKGGRKKLISRTLKEFEDLLREFKFFRTHHSYLVNLSHVKEFVRADGGYLVLTNQMHIPVARSKREDLLRQF